MKTLVFAMRHSSSALRMLAEFCDRHGAPASHVEADQCPEEVV
jgi:hypothetical protein